MNNERALDEVQLVDVGRALASALVYWQSWCHRKVEAISLLEGERARRRVSVDLTVLDLRWPIAREVPRWRRDRRQALVPLATIAKASMRRFDVIDDAGTGLPILGADDNGALGTAFLAQLISSESDRALDEELRRKVSGVVLGEPQPATDLALALVEELGLRETVSEQFLVRLAQEFILFALVPPERIGSRMVIKYSYHWETGDLQPKRGWRTALRDRTLAAIGWKPFALALEVGAPDTAQSVHIEIPAPVGLHCVDLTVSDGETVFAVDRVVGTVAHAHATFAQDVGAVKATVRLDPDPTGVHRLVTLSAFAVAALLIVTGLRLDEVAADPGTPVSLMLFGPALMLTLLVRPGENAVVAAIVGPLRYIAVGLAGLLFAGGVALGVGLSPRTLGVAWWVGASVSVSSGIVLAVGSLAIVRRVHRGRRGSGR